MFEAFKEAQKKCLESSRNAAQARPGRGPGRGPACLAAQVRDLIPNGPEGFRNPRKACRWARKSSGSQGRWNPTRRQRMKPKNKEFKNRRPVDVTEEYNYCNYLFIRFDWVVIYFSMGPGQIHLNSWLHIFIFYVDNYILYMSMHITCHVDIMCLLICFYNMPCIHAHSLLFILFIIKVF